MGPQKQRIIAVGQIPPPHGGQAVMIAEMLAGNYQAFEFIHVRMAFSKDLGDSGQPGVRKVCHLLGISLRIIWARFRYQASILYYPPAGPRRIPMYRDLFILISTRWCFRKRIFHFHAGGLSELYDTLPAITRLLFRIAYFRPDVAIRTAELAPDDSTGIQAQRSVVVLNGIPDHYLGRDDTTPSVPAVILFVGLICPSKGVGVLLEACRLLVQRGCTFQVNLVGPMESAGYRRGLEATIREGGLAGLVSFLDVLTGPSKYSVYAGSTIFCNPTFFESETFSLVILEAMQFGLPVVATRWRGIPSVVDDGHTGFLVEPRDTVALADKLEYLLQEPDTGREMGRNGRERYLSMFTLEHFHRSIDAAISGILETREK